MYPVTALRLLTTGGTTGLVWTGRASVAESAVRRRPWRTPSKFEITRGDYGAWGRRHLTRTDREITRARLERPGSDWTEAWPLELPPLPRGDYAPRAIRLAVAADLPL